MINRAIEPKIKEMAAKFPVIALLGPRQSGKTTLAKKVFTKHVYVNLEDLELRQYAKADPKGFLQTQIEQSKSGIILDEFQHVPDILSYVQILSDELDALGFFVLTGSQNFLMNQATSQTLAGRVSLFTLLPLDQSELQASQALPDTAEKAIFKGAYPRLYNRDIEPQDFYPDYIQTYLERDVRDMKQVGDLLLFKTFVKLCAGRVGQLLNISSIANDCGISVPTAKSWISLLEASYLVFLLQPHHTNFNKRLVKMPKLYFYDTGLVCSLLGIESSQEVTFHYLRGGLFESYVISEIIKKRYNKGRLPNCYFWRDKTGNEVDCIIEQGQKLHGIEIKAGKTITQSYFAGLNYWSNIAKDAAGTLSVVYAGEQKQDRTHSIVRGWQNIEDVLQNIYAR